MIPLGQISESIDRLLAARPYYPCCLLVHTNVQRLQQVADSLVDRAGWPSLSVGTTLGHALLPLEPAHRPAQTMAILSTALHPYVPGPVLCTDIDLLFEPCLALDPLRLFRDLSRQVPLVVLWPGSYANGILAYAVPEHGHYRLYRRTELVPECLIPLP